MPGNDYEEEPTPEELAELHIRSILDQGISQRELSRITGIPRSTIGDFLRGTHHPSARTLDRIFSELGTFD